MLNTYICKIGLIILSIVFMSGCSKEKIIYNKETMRWEKVTEVLKIVNDDFDKYKVYPVYEARKQLQESMNNELFTR